MASTLRKKIIDLLHEHRIMTVATNRPDGWPQATTVGYVSEGVTLYFLCSPQSQKAQNLARDNRLSLAIDHDVSDPMAIRGLSMAARASGQRTSRDVQNVRHAGGQIPRIRLLPTTQATGDLDLSDCTRGDLGTRLLEGIWSYRPRHALIGPRPAKFSAAALAAICLQVWPSSRVIPIRAGGIYVMASPMPTQTEPQRRGIQ